MCFYLILFLRKLCFPNSLILGGALCLILCLALLLILCGALLGVHRLILGLAHILCPVVALRSIVVVVPLS